VFEPVFEYLPKRGFVIKCVNIINLNFKIIHIIIL
jgi:hypothetical protein